MTVAFTSEDPVNCPITQYKIDSINDYELNIDRPGLDSTVTSTISLDEDSGLFSIKNCSKPMQWLVWISAQGKDGTGSGKSDTFNIKINLFEPPPLKTSAP